MAVYTATTHCPAWCANQVGLLWGRKGHRADTKQSRSSVGIWEYGCPGLVEMKTHLQTKRAQYPEESAARWDHGAAGFSFQTYYQYRSRSAAIDHRTLLKTVRSGSPDWGDKIQMCTWRRPNPTCLTLTNPRVLKMIFKCPKSNIIKAILNLRAK